jgi:hypothetical protein
MGIGGVTSLDMTIMLPPPSTRVVNTVPLRRLGSPGR